MDLLSYMPRAKVARGLMWNFALRLLRNMEQALVDRNTTSYHAVNWHRRKGRAWNVIREPVKQLDTR